MSISGMSGNAVAVEVAPSSDAVAIAPSRRAVVVSRTGSGVVLPARQELQLPLVVGSHIHGQAKIFESYEAKDSSVSEFAGKDSASELGILERVALDAATGGVFGAAANLLVRVLA